MVISSPTLLPEKGRMSIVSGFMDPRKLNATAPAGAVSDAIEKQKSNRRRGVLATHINSGNSIGANRRGSRWMPLLDWWLIVWFVWSVSVRRQQERGVGHSERFAAAPHPKSVGADVEAAGPALLAQRHQSHGGRAARRRRRPQEVVACRSHTPYLAPALSLVSSSHRFTCADGTYPTTSGLHDLFAAMCQACPSSTHCRELASLSDSLSNAQLLEFLMAKFYANWNKGDAVCTCQPDPATTGGPPPPAGAGTTFEDNEVEARVITTVEQRVQVARTKAFPGQWIIGIIKKVDATQILVQYEKAPYSEAKGEPPKYWFQVDSGNVRVMPDAQGMQSCVVGGGVESSNHIQMAGRRALSLTVAGGLIDWLIG
jgi:hypothetical protein